LVSALGERLEEGCLFPWKAAVLIQYLGNTGTEEGLAFLKMWKTFSLIGKYFSILWK
jgi:hypothetical protein